MTTALRTRLIKIGNSRGIRLPKAVLEQAGLEQEVEIEVRGGEIVLRSASHPRADWDAAFEAMAARGDDALLDGEPLLTQWDETEWAW